MQTAFAVQPDKCLDRPQAPIEPAHAACSVYSIDRASAGVAANAVDGTGPIVFVIDRGASVRDLLAQSSRSFGWQVRAFASAHEFLDSPPVLSPSCLVLDAALPQLDVLELQERIATDRPGMPIILIAGMTAAPTTLQARPTGTVRLFAQPLCDALLVDAIAKALERSQPAFAQWAQVRNLHKRYASLTRREREVMALVVCGRLNKQVGADLGISEITVKAHRGCIMRKMRAASLPSLVAMAARLGLEGPEDGTF